MAKISKITIGMMVKVRFHGSFYWVMIEMTIDKYIALRACALPVTCKVQIATPEITKILSSLCHFSYVRKRSQAMTSHRWYMVLVRTAINATMASNSNPFLLNKDTIEMIPKALVTITTAPIITLSISVRFP